MSDNNTPAPIIQQVVTVQDNTISIGQWIFMFIVQGIPVIGLIMLIIWALDSSNRTRANYARAIFVLMLIGIILAVIFGTAVFAGLTNLVRQVS